MLTPKLVVLTDANFCYFSNGYINCSNGSRLTPNAFTRSTNGFHETFNGLLTVN